MNNAILPKHAAGLEIGGRFVKSEGCGEGSGKAPLDGPTDQTRSAAAITWAARLEPAVLAAVTAAESRSLPQSWQLLWVHLKIVGPRRRPRVHGATPCRSVSLNDALCRNRKGYAGAPIFTAGSGRPHQRALFSEQEQMLHACFRRAEG